MALLPLYLGFECILISGLCVLAKSEILSPYSTTGLSEIDLFLNGVCLAYSTVHLLFTLNAVLAGYENQDVKGIGTSDITYISVVFAMSLGLQFLVWNFYSYLSSLQQELVVTWVIGTSIFVFIHSCMLIILAKNLSKASLMAIDSTPDRASRNIGIAFALGIIAFCYLLSIFWIFVYLRSLDYGILMGQITLSVLIGWTCVHAQVQKQIPYIGLFHAAFLSIYSIFILSLEQFFCGDLLKLILGLALLIPAITGGLPDGQYRLIWTHTYCMFIGCYLFTMLTETCFLPEWWKIWYAPISVFAIQIAFLSYIWCVTLRPSTL